eukprot:670796-Pyramimonas_sp.AAC.1
MDKSPKQVRREIQTKAMAAALREQKPNLRSRHDRQRGAVFVDGSPCVQVQVGNERDDSTRLLWNYSVLQKHGINTDELAAAFNNKFHTEERVQWQT